MGDDEQRLIEDAKKNREQTQELREESGLGRDADPGEPETGHDRTTEAPEGEPWAKTSSGDAESVTDDD